MNRWQTDPMTIPVDDLLREAERLIARGGGDDPRGEGERLLGAVWGVGVGEVRMQRLLGRDVPDPVARAVRAGARARGRRIPLQHIVGTAPFRDLDLRVGPGVFVPRPETEQLVESALAGRDGPVRRAVDLGAGSGAIAISLSRAYPDARVIAFEASAAAWPWLRRNAREHAPRVELRFGDWVEQLARVDGEIDLIVSNPPYVPARDLPGDPEVFLHDPAMALFSGADGLDEIRRIARYAVPRLARGGEILLEHAENQGESIRALLEAAGMQSATTTTDLTGRERFTRAVAGQVGSERKGTGLGT